MPEAGDGDDSTIDTVTSTTGTKSKCIDKNSILIYLSHFLSSFGDRIWGFAVAIYLYYLQPCSLMLTAIYGLSTCGSLFLLGAPVGRWVEKSKRLKAARVTILIQNVSVVASSALMASAIYYKHDLQSVWNGWLVFILYASIILIAIIAELASMANKLVLEKDWIVVLARGDEQKLSNLNSTMRTINLTCKIVAPFMVGHVLTWFSYVEGAIFIASWNVVSAIAEYYLLFVIFSLVPELATKGNQKKVSPENLAILVKSVPVESSSTSLNDSSYQDSESISKTGANRTNNNHTTPLSRDEGTEDVRLITPVSQSTCPNSEFIKPENSQGNVNSGDPRSVKEKEHRICKFCDGWQKYFSHPVKFAGIGLSSLYMTVLSFDSVTIGYLSYQGVSAGLVGNLTAVAALIGILGSISFPFFRKKFGKNKAGLFGFGMETMCLLMCVVSILLPGSPFDPEALLRPFNTTCRNKDTADLHSLSLKELWDKHVNIYLLMAGIVTARFGLWIADLSVTQTFQEQVDESERGVMSGVQGSLNQLMSLMKFGLTILLPYPDTFGYLIILSWIFVFLGWVFFGVFVHQENSKKKRETT